MYLMLFQMKNESEPFTIPPKAEKVTERCFIIILNLNSQDTLIDFILSLEVKILFLFALLAPFPFINKHGFVQLYC